MSEKKGIDRSKLIYYTLYLTGAIALLVAIGWWHVSYAGCVEPPMHIIALIVLSLVLLLCAVYMRLRIDKLAILEKNDLTFEETDDTPLTK